MILVGQATVDFQIWSFDPKVTSFDALNRYLPQACAASAFG